jgi:hypothetical protein
MPPTSIIAAGLDPMLDDAVLFAHRCALFKDNVHASSTRHIVYFQ